MKQKITIEIENDTGVEFEEKIELRPLRRGDYWFNGCDKIVGPIEGDYGAFRYVLTPKIDHELEEAKKLIGKWVVFKDKDVILKVRDVLRDSYSKALTFEAISQSGNLAQFYLRDFNNFPLPTWRCCEAEKPKKAGEYAMRSKGSKKIFSGKYSITKTLWDWTSVIDCPYSDYEWLDEGGE